MKWSKKNWVYQDLKKKIKKKKEAYLKEEEINYNDIEKWKNEIVMIRVGVWIK